MNDDREHQDYAGDPIAGGIAKVFVWGIALVFVGAFVYGLLFD